jgi:hypothetical protein
MSSTTLDEWLTAAADIDPVQMPVMVEFFAVGNGRLPTP